MPPVRTTPHTIPNRSFFGMEAEWDFGHDTNQAVLSICQTNSGRYFVSCAGKEICFWKANKARVYQRDMDAYKTYRFKEGERSWRPPNKTEEALEKFRPASFEMLVGSKKSGSPITDDTVVCGGQRGLRLMDVEEGSIKKALEEYTIRCIIRLVNHGTKSENVILCGCDADLVVFDVNSWKIITTMKGSSDEYQRIRAVCELTTTTAVEAAISPSSSSPTSSSFSSAPSRKKLVLSGLEKDVELWDWDANKMIRKFKGHAEPVYGVAEIYDTATFASCAQDWTICIWNVDTGDRLRCWQAGKFPMRGLKSFREPDGRTVLFSGSDDRCIRLWNTNGACLDCIGTKNFVRTVSLLKDGLVACGKNWGDTMIFSTHRK